MPRKNNDENRLRRLQLTLTIAFQNGFPKFTEDSFEAANCDTKSNNDLSQKARYRKIIMMRDDLPFDI